MNRNDVELLEPTLDAIGLLADVGTVGLDRNYDYPAIRAQLHERGLHELDIQKRGTKPPPGQPHRLTLGLRRVVEATNTWWSNYGQLRRNTDRRTRHQPRPPTYTASPPHAHSHPHHPPNGGSRPSGLVVGVAILGAHDATSGGTGVDPKCQPTSMRSSFNPRNTKWSRYSGSGVVRSIRSNRSTSLPIAERPSRRASEAPRQ